jgi:hypothetical protein
MRPNLIKYVVLDGIAPVSFKSPKSHKDMLALGAITSAGYYHRDVMGNITIAGEAFSIPIPNGPHDKELLEKFWEEHP